MAKTTYYEVDMLFSVSLGLREINDALEQMGVKEQLHVRNAGEISVKGIYKEIPDDAYLLKVADILRENYKTSKTTVTECRFVGFRSVKKVEMEEK